MGRFYDKGIIYQRRQKPRRKHILSYRNEKYLNKTNYNIKIHKHTDDNTFTYDMLII
jgi:hypothetical protein